MVEGAKLLLETGPLYFWTITCRGKDLDLETSDDDYLLWTNRLLSACRYHAKKSGARWAYVQVTERQKRGAAHSHFLHTWVPSDSQYRRNGKGHVDVTSDYFVQANVKAGLGPQCKISQVSSAVGVSSYVAKYLKKHLSDTVWPSNWRRIRYSQDFPDTTEQPDYAIALTSNDAWARLETYAVANRQHFIAADRVAYEIGRRRIVGIEPPVMLETVG